MSDQKPEPRDVDDPWEPAYLRELRALAPAERAVAAEQMGEDAEELAADAERWKRRSRVLAIVCVLGVAGYYGLGWMASSQQWWAIAPAVSVTIAIAAFVALMATVARWLIRRTESNELLDDRDELLAAPQAPTR